ERRRSRRRPAARPFRSPVLLRPRDRDERISRRPASRSDLRYLPVPPAFCHRWLRGGSAAPMKDDSMGRRRPVPAAGSRAAPFPPPPPGAVPRRSWLRRLYMTLRTEHRTPGKVAFAVGVGAFVGCSPLWGLHFALSVLVATLFRLNRMLVYAAANLSNPLTAPPLYFAEIQAGHRLLHGAWLPISIRDVEALGVTGVLSDLIVGSVVVGLVLGAACGSIAWLATRSDRHARSYLWIADQIVIRYVD